MGKVFLRGMLASEHAATAHDSIPLSTGTIIRPPPQTAAPLTVLGFQRYAGTGTMGNPFYLNDNNTGTGTALEAVNDYTEVDWGIPRRISEWRQYGNITNNGDGRFKIQYWDGSAWVDWETGIATRTTADWSAWSAPAAGAKTTEKIRIVCTTVDTGLGGGYIMELELRSAA